MIRELLKKQIVISKKLWVSVIFVCFLFISVSVIVKNYRRTYFKLTNKYTWVWVKYNDTMIIDSNNNKIIGPGLITLWAEYPWIYGTFSKKRKGYKFAINILTDKVIQINSINNSEVFKKNIRLGRASASNQASHWSNFFYKNNFKLEKLVTFFDVADGHQWQRKYKKEKLLSIIAGSEKQGQK